LGARRGTLALVAADGAAPVSPGAALLEEMLAGWRRRRQARRLTVRLVGERERVVRQFAEFTGCWPWQWTAAQAEAWLASAGWAHSAIRSYQGALALFLEYVCDPRYGWAAECEQRAGAVPVQVFRERNTAAHVAGYEGRAERRPLTRAELQAFFDAADDHVEKAAGSGRQGGWPGSATRRCSRWSTGGGCAAGRRRCWTWPISRRIRRRRSWAGWGYAMSGSARRCGAARRAAGRWPR
jgi:hypothetical protein